MISMYPIIAGSRKEGFLNEYSFLFDGVDENINIPDDASLDFTTKLTVSAWIKQTILGIDKAIVVKWDYNTQGSWGFQTDATYSDELRVFLADSLTDSGVNWESTTAANLIAGNWYNTIFVYDGGGATDPDKLKIYVNGVNQTLYFNGTIPASLQNSSASLKIGKFGGILYRFFDGNIDEVGLFNTDLNAAQISEIYNSGTPKNLLNHSASANLVSYFRMGDGDTWGGTNWTVIDNKGTNNGTSVNMEEADRVLDVP